MPFRERFAIGALRCTGGHGGTARTGFRRSGFGQATEIGVGAVPPCLPLHRRNAPRRDRATSVEHRVNPRACPYTAAMHRAEIEQQA
jgi:hypothetical protein